MLVDVKINMSDWDIFYELFLRDEFKVGVISEAINYFDSFPAWEEDEKQNICKQTIQTIKKSLSTDEQEVFVHFLKFLLKNLEPTNDKPCF